MISTNLNQDNSKNLVLSNENLQQSETWEKLKELHILGEIKPGDRISTETGDITNTLSRLAKMFAGEYQVIQRTLADGNFQEELVRISSPITANICHEIPESTEQLTSQLKEYGHILIRTGQPLDQDQIIKLIGGSKKLMNYRYGNQERKQVPGSIYLNVTPWQQEMDILPHNELTYHTEFPQNVCFICKQPTEYGGETTIYDCQQAFANLSPSFQKEAIEKNIIFAKKYVQQRNHPKYSSWQQMFDENTTTEEVIAHWTTFGYTCLLHQESENGEIIDIVETQIERPIAYNYNGNTCLHASIVGVAPYWYREIWQDKEPQVMLKSEDGELYPEERVQEMEEAIKSARIFYNNLQENDVLLLDNPRIAHGRLPFRGDRVVGVLMGGKGCFEFQENGWVVEEK